MLRLFRYNWMVRDEWFETFGAISEDELLRERTGGVGSILKTLFHIVDVECSWIRAIKGEPDPELAFHDNASLDKIRQLSAQYRSEVEDFLVHWTNESDGDPVTPSGMNETFTQGEILRHVIAHEIHHVGQLSVWAKELGLQAVSANFIRRGL
ncbi:DinB family protein [Paenibacillus ehimensis]|uniref:DinB family protein n=1 Tax=Paenibacillus ehimensis TaxID=79264 RepID=A0ABT8V526_9BACL|nr:DinB family protein [Paenibacillus ehimensis]MDO3676542.1 DinB family protein [Paenibacillus ehimensis]